MRTLYWKTTAALAAATLTLSACSGDDAPTPDSDGSSETVGAASNTEGESGEDCTPRNEDIETIEDGVLTIAQYEYPPFSIYDETTGELTGVEGEILTMFAEAQCLETTVVQGDSPAMITSVDTGRADITLGSWYRTEERAEVVRLSEPIITSPLSIVSQSGTDNVDDLLALDVGVSQGLIAVEDLQDLFGSDLNIYQNVDAVFSDLQAGRIEAAVLGYGAAITQLENSPVDGAEIMPIEPDERIASTVDVGQTNFPVNQENEALGEAVDEFVLEMRDQGVIEELAGEYGFSPEVANPGEANLL